MSLSINSLNSLPAVNLPETSAAIAPSIGSSAGASSEFQSLLEGMVGKVEQSQAQAKTAVDTFLSGGSEELHSVAMASQRAELEFDLFLQVRNKVVSAYQEVMRMQV